MNPLLARLSAAGALAALAGWSALSQAQSPTRPQPPKKEAPKEREVRIAYDEMVHSETTGEGEARKVVLVDGETQVMADRAKWNTKTKVLEGTGNLLMTDPQADGTSEKAVVYWDKGKRLAVLTGNVTITVKPRRKDTQPPPGPPPAGPAPVVLEEDRARVKGDDEEDSPRRHPAVITCDKVEYRYARNQKHAVLTGNFKVVQKLKDKTRTLTARYAEWFGREERILLHGPVKWEDSEGNGGEAPGDVTVYTAENDERIIVPGKGTAILRVKEEDEEEAPPAPSAPSPVR